MTTEYVVPVEQRLGRKKGVARKIRAQGRIPAILYGPDRDKNVMLTVNPKDIVEAIKKHGESVLLRLEPQGRFDNGFSGALAIIKELQRDPITYRIIHADFLEISEERAVEVNVALRFVGKPEGLRSGGVLHYVKEEITINVLPRQIPDFIEVDISHLNIGDDIKAKDIALPEGATLAEDPEDVLIQVLAPRVEVAAEEKPAEEEEKVEEVAEKKEEEKVEPESKEE